MYQASKELKIKHSNPFSCVCRYKNNDGTPINLTGHSLKADIKNSNEQLVSTTSITIINAEEGLFTVTSDKPLPLALSGLFMDVRDTVNDMSANSEILKITISKVVTYG